MIPLTLDVPALLCSGAVNHIGTLLVIAHVVMLPAMLVAILLHRDEYTGHHHDGRHAASALTSRFRGRSWPGPGPTPEPVACLSWRTAVSVGHALRIQHRQPVRLLARRHRTMVLSARTTLTELASLRRRTRRPRAAALDLAFADLARRWKRRDPTEEEL